MELVIERTLELNASPERVWKAITDPGELSRWFPDRAEMTVEPGGRGALTWEEHGTFDVQVVDVEPLRRFAWRWSGNDGRPLAEYSTLVEWTLTPRADGGTTLHLRESGFDTRKHFEQNTGGWKSELGELVALLSG